MAKHVVDLDEAALAAARMHLGAATVQDTVNAVLRRVASGRGRAVAAALELLGDADLDDRAAAWR